MTSVPTQFTLEPSSGIPIVLSADEYRLALLWLVDFEQAWEGIEAATAFVPDGEAKLALVRTRLRLLAGPLAELGTRLDPLSLLIARHWFRNGVCVATNLETQPT